MQPLRLTFKQTCQILNISRDKLRLLTLQDESFPRPIKCGNTKQASVYFDYIELKYWHEKQKKNIEAEN